MRRRTKPPHSEGHFFLCSVGLSLLKQDWKWLPPVCGDLFNRNISSRKDAADKVEAVILLTQAFGEKLPAATRQ